jgi:hypothetical protein
MNVGVRFVRDLYRCASNAFVGDFVASNRLGRPAAARALFRVSRAKRAIYFSATDNPTFTMDARTS